MDETYRPTIRTLFDPTPGAVVVARGRTCTVQGPAANGFWSFRSNATGITLTEYPERVR